MANKKKKSARPCLKQGRAFFEAIHKQLTYKK